MRDLPYPVPIAVKTSLRCQFSMPRRCYNCRYTGKYTLDNKRYCAAHYDIVWKVANPELGAQHAWHMHTNKLTGVTDNYPSCIICGAIKVHDGLPQCLCRGHMPVITLR